MKIPFFIKKLGYEIISYILNISNDDAKEVLENKFKLNNLQEQVLKQYIKHLQDIKLQNIDQDNSNSLVLSYLGNLITKDKEHFFNYFRKFCNGTIPTIVTDNIIEQLTYKLAIETYPLFLIKNNDDFSYNIGLSQMATSVFYSLPETKELQNELIKDDTLKKLFSKGKDEYDTSIKSISSDGRGSTIQLALVPQLIILKIYELMVLKREVTINDLEKYTKIIITMYRELSINKKLKVSSFIGFENVSIPNNTNITDSYGSIRGYDKIFYENIPHYLRPSTYNGNDNYLGFVLETSFDYDVKLDINLGDDFKFPPQYKNKYDDINKIKDKLSLAFTLSNNEKLIGIQSRWTLVFNILSQGTSVGWTDRNRSDTTSYSEKELKDISKWYNIINNVNDSKIEIAIHRVLSATNNRNNNLDSFIDSIIALENIFGHGSGEIGFKLSMGVAFLLKNKPNEIALLQKTVNDLYSNKCLTKINVIF
jgi:hypothetical protein